ncbi:MAG: hypothetical protein AB1659_01765 [Thermodesulfobacteriota bacterium]
MIPAAKRIKRRVIGRTHDFLITTLPGFESLCFQEFRSFPNAVRNGRIIKGGMEFQGRLTDCYSANLYSRTGNRILMRIDDIQATRFSEFEKKISQIPWELYLSPGSCISIRTTVHHSRLFHTKGISERIRSGITKSLNSDLTTSTGLLTKRQTLFVRGLDDRFTLSMDSSGENLYKRGLKVHVGAAPLRETTAAGALLLAGYLGDLPVIDPFCGSGTFSLEASLIAGNIPPGWFRSFAFVEWPSFRKESWNFLRRQAETTIRIAGKKPSIFASDINEATCLQLKERVDRFGLSDIISVSHIDFFDLDPKRITPRKGFVTINPPYGWRLETESKSDLLVQAVADRLRSLYRGWKFILFTPEQNVQKMFAPSNRYRVPHGGRMVTLLIGEIR